MYIQYGEWKINADITKTRSYYSAFEKPVDQYSRNFQAYCDSLTSEERAFFDSFGIDPKCVYVESVGKTDKNTTPTSGYYYLYGSYESAPSQAEISVEELMKNGFGKALKDNSFKVGSFVFEFQRDTDPCADIPGDMPESCICLRFFCEDMKWLLKEKSGKSAKRPSRFERMLAGISKKLFSSKGRDAKKISCEGGNLLTATCF